MDTEAALHGSYLFFRALLRTVFFLAVFLAAFLAVFFAVFLAGFLTAFLAAFLAAALCLRRAGAAFLGAATAAAAIGIAGIGVDGAGMDGIAGLAGVMGAAAGALIASSQPGVNISSRSRYIALARPQRGQRAS